MPNWVTNNFIIHAKGDTLNDILKSIQGENDVLGSFDFNKVIPMPDSLNVTDGSITMEAIEAFLSHLKNEAQKQDVRSIPSDDFLKYWSTAETIGKKSFFREPMKFLSDKEISSRAEKHIMTPSDFVGLGKTYLDNQIQYGAHTWYYWRIENWGTKWPAEKGSLLQGENILSFETAWSAPIPVIAKLSEKFPKVSFFLDWADEDIGQNVGSCGFLAGEAVDLYLPNPGSKEAYDLAFSIRGISPADCFLRYDEAQNEYVYDKDLENAYYEAFTPGKAALDDVIQSATERTESEDKATIPAEIER